MNRTDAPAVADADVELFLSELVGNSTFPDSETDYLAEQVGIDAWESFQQAGILTDQRGLVLRFRDGSEFQVSIVRSR
jgi:hypothetical protein